MLLALRFATRKYNNTESIVVHCIILNVKIQKLINDGITPWRMMGTTYVQSGVCDSGQCNGTGCARHTKTLSSLVILLNTLLLH